jgi:glycosyltransferase involved in cell wall biosynthesis
VPAKRGGKRTIAFVAPFFGAEATGGAETECRETAIKLAQHGFDVHVLTTSVRDLHHNWNEDHYPPGDSEEDGLTVHRFTTNKLADMGPFGDLNTRLISLDKLTRSEERQFMAMHVNSFDLLRYLEAHQAEYDWVCFIPYLFATTCYGSMLCPGKVVLIPCLHDEGYSHMGIMKDVFDRATKVVFQADAEKRIAERLYGSLGDRSTVMGTGLDLDFESDPDRFREKYNINEPFILYAGRKAVTKNTNALIEYFSEYKRNKGGDLKLIMMGPEELPVPDDMFGVIRDLGFVSDQEKKDAYSAAYALCQPSLNESFSIVMMESWICNRPCMVHTGCEVTRDHVEASGGGLHFSDYHEFERGLDYLLSNPAVADTMGEAGAEYVRSRYDWTRIIERYTAEVLV